MAAAAVIDKDEFSSRLRNEATIFAEAKAIEPVALEHTKSLNVHILQYFQISFFIFTFLFTVSS